MSFIKGPDISSLPELEEKRVQFFDEGKKDDLLQILKNNNFGYIRLRI